jgi:Ca-activated chloride channel family protein
MELMSWEIALIIGLTALPLLVYLYLRKRRRSAILFSSVKLFNGVRASLRYRLRHIPFILFIAGLLCLMIALARPRKGDELAVDYTEGIAIQMVLDRSSSMVDEKTTIGGEVRTYFDVAKEVAIDFIEGNEELSGRKNDMIGLSSFAAYVQENCPMTLDHKNLVRTVDSVRPAIPRTKEDGTSIGDAIYHSVLTQVSTEEYLKENDDEYSIQSKIMILLTDGIQTAGEKEIKQAAEFAKDNDIKVYTILFAGKSLQRAINMRNQQIIAYLNQLQDAADLTGAEFYLAFDNESLRQVYENIDQLEKSKIKESYYRYHELFSYFLIAGLALLFLEMILSETVFRKVP